MKLHIKEQTNSSITWDGPVGLVIAAAPCHCPATVASTTRVHRPGLGSSSWGFFESWEQVKLLSLLRTPSPLVLSGTFSSWPERTHPASYTFPNQNQSAAKHIGFILLYGYTDNLHIIITWSTIPYRKMYFTLCS